MNIGRLFGIQIRIDPSWLIIFALVTYNLTLFLRHFFATWTPASYWLVSALASLCFFASVLAHELAHSLVARAQGVQVRSITLFLLGGVAQLQKEPPTARVELTTALAGPLTSFGLGVLLIGLGRGTLTVDTAALFQQGSTTGSLSPLSTIFLWLGAVNILMAVFNMIPGFPLDGGRVLRAALWGLTRDLYKATRWTTWIGQAIAWSIMAVGFSFLFGVQIPGLGSGLASGLWLIIIGWFLNTASASTYQQAEMRHKLTGVPVVRLMRRDAPTVQPSWTVGDVFHMHGGDRDEQAFPVLDDLVLVGIVTREDLIKIPREAWPDTLIEQVMTPEEKLATIAPDEDASQAMERLQQRGVRQLPVVRDNCEFLGLLRHHDILRWLQLNQEARGV
jgi:Zn-dependent protease/CBS domain-containing protein